MEEQNSSKFTCLAMFVFNLLQLFMTLNTEYRGSGYQTLTQSLAVGAAESETFLWNKSCSNSTRFKSNHVFNVTKRIFKRISSKLISGFLFK